MPREDTKNNLQYKIAVLGEKEAVLGFYAVGLKVFVVENEKEAVDKLAKIKGQNDIGILFITEYFYNILKEELREIEGQVLPAVVVIPDHTGSKEIGMRKMKGVIEKAVGSDILSR
ncbi:V-type ATP synthase subunit F [bacterium (Candidatus Torokbacteria) CG_4_10_14_0_2_um_filter_35_8]|nr:MAG: V-type ATP synthase subunit F [bacterium (Candidatus Torokbacteria) CG_4_10_14_0_2_um_filter_35_8]